MSFLFAGALVLAGTLAATHAAPEPALASAFTEPATPTERDVASALVSATENEPPGLSTCMSQDGRPCHGTTKVRCTSSDGVGWCFCVDGAYVCADPPHGGLALAWLGDASPTSCLHRAVE